jgi:hypothetical protein
MLVDFDWCGEEGEAVYPASINMDVRWPEDVCGGALLKASHDDFMFLQLVTEAYCKEWCHPLFFSTPAFYVL